MPSISRRRAALGAAAGAVFLSRRVGAAAEMRQFHNQTAESPLHRRLVQLWDAVEQATQGKIKARVFAENDNLPGGDPAVLALLRAGELDFFTVMGGILGEVVPAMDVEGIPFAFRNHDAVYAALDGELGTHLRAECAAKGIYALPRGCFENGFRHITTASRPIARAADLSGLRIRTPQSEIFLDLFRSLGAAPVAVNVNQLYGALKSGAVEAQENPLVIAATFKLYEVQRYVSFTSHMWSGFNSSPTSSAGGRCPRRRARRSSAPSPPTPGCSAPTTASSTQASRAS
jgi:tripartite ATP-independent transporter DctP family solute receptor